MSIADVTCLKELFLLWMGNLASDRIINLNLYCTVNGNVALISLLLGYIRQKKWWDKE